MKKAKMTNFQKDFCKRILKKLEKKPISKPFYKPLFEVVADKNALVGTIEEHMCLSLVQEKLDRDEYDSIVSFAKDVKLIWMNAKKYIVENNPVRLMALDLETWFNKKCPTELKNDLKQVLYPRYPEERWREKLVSLGYKFNKIIDLCPYKMELIPDKVLDDEKNEVEV